MDLSFVLEHKLVVSVLAGILSILYALFLSYRVLSHEKGDKKMNDISDAISEGAVAYMKRQYSVVAGIGVLIFVILYFVFGFITRNMHFLRIHHHNVIAGIDMGGM